MEPPNPLVRRVVAPNSPTATSVALPIGNLLTPEDVGFRLGISRKALERWRGTGDGPRFVRLGHKTVRYRLEDIEAFIVARLCISTAS